LGKKVEIEAWSKAQPVRASAKAAPAKHAAKKSEPAYKNGDGEDISDVDLTPLTEAEMTSLTEDIRTFCAGILKYVVDEEVQVEAQVADDRLILNINNDELMQQINRNPKLAESLEHILRKKPRYLKRELPFRIFVDVNGVRQKRENDLISMAHDLSEKVFENKRPIVLNYKSSYDRKIIHMALDKDERVYTKSIGSGPNRKLMILPSSSKRPMEQPEA
jgi:spoIIIJ-associated protein